MGRVSPSLQCPEGGENTPIRDRSDHEIDDRLADAGSIHRERDVKGRHRAGGCG